MFHLNIFKILWQNIIIFRIDRNKERVMDKSRVGKILYEFIWKIPVILIIYFLLSIPDPPKYSEEVEDSELSMLINEETHDVWERISNQISNPRYDIDCIQALAEFQVIAKESEELAISLKDKILDPESADIILLENYLYELGSYTYHCPALYDEFIASVSQSILAIKNQAGYWDYSSFNSKKRLHNFFNGSRAFIDEILKKNYSDNKEWISIYQSTDLKLDSLISAGDIVATRREDVFSTIVSYANLYPGPYSNLLTVYEENNLKTIELDYLQGPVSKPIQEINSSSSRILLCRTKSSTIGALNILDLENDLNIDENGNNIYSTILSSNIPFDFSRNINDPDEIFDYELIALVSKQNDEILNGGISSYQNSQLKRWLSQLGMENFEPYSSTDIVYDPTIVLVGEWVNPSLVINDHINNIALETILRESMSNEEINYSRVKLPIERVNKGISRIRKLLGRNSTEPFGLNATESLKLKTISKQYDEIRIILRREVQSFLSLNNRLPNYLEIRGFANSLE